MTTTARVNRLVKAAIPKGKPFRVIWQPTGVGRWQILRVITPAWKSLPRSERVHRMRQAVEPNLTPRERDRIFRFSVLTRAELKRLEQMLPAGRRSGSRKSSYNGRYRRAAA